VELFKKNDSRFYWYDFKWRGKRYRRSTKETNKKRAGKIAALRLSQAMGGGGLSARMQEFSIRFLIWVESALPEPDITLERELVAVSHLIREVGRLWRALRKPSPTELSKKCPLHMGRVRYSTSVYG
jgi:hypothetical protein